MMARNSQHRLTLDQPASYEIKVPGELDLNWSDWAGSVTVKIEHGDTNLPITTLAGTFDQAALHGFLRKLYSLGLPLISVNLVDVKNDKK